MLTLIYLLIFLVVHDDFFRFLIWLPANFRWFGKSSWKTPKRETFHYSSSSNCIDLEEKMENQKMDDYLSVTIEVRISHEYLEKKNSTCFYVCYEYLRKTDPARNGIWVKLPIKYLRMCNRSLISQFEWVIIPRVASLFVHPDL